MPPKAMSFLPDAPTEFVAGDIPGGEAQSLVQSIDIPGQWWGVFQSPQLNGLIETALRANPDIKAAAAGLKQARENARAQRATLFPTLQAGFGASQNQTPSSLSPATAAGALIYGLFTVGLTLTYNLDLWGANRRQIESLDALAEAQCFQLEGAYLSLASNVVAAAILEASLRAQVEATQRIIAAQRDTLGILQRQSGLGAIPGGDVAVQQAALAQAEATLPPLQKALAQQRNLLATLTGRFPDQNLVEQFTPRRPQAAAGTAAQPAVQAGRATARRARRRGQSALCQRPGRRRDRQPAAEHHLEPRPQHPVTQHRHAVRAGPDRQRPSARACCRRSSTAARSPPRSAPRRPDWSRPMRSIARSCSRPSAMSPTCCVRWSTMRWRSRPPSTPSAPRRPACEIARRRLELGDTTYVVVLLAELTYQQALLGRVQAQANRYTDTAALFQALGGGWWNRDTPEPDAKAGPPRCRPPDQREHQRAHPQCRRDSANAAVVKSEKLRHS